MTLPTRPPVPSGHVWHTFCVRHQERDRLRSHLHGVGIELLGHAAHRLSDDDTVTGFAAQVASDQAGLAEFYRKYFRRQGSFPVLERKL